MFENAVRFVKYPLRMASSALPQPPRPAGRPDARSRHHQRRRSLSLEAIVEAALAIVDDEGLDALTMRTVAATLGTGAASLYAYVSTKEELIELLVERVIGEIHFTAEPDPSRWMAQIKELAWQMRRVFASHGDLARASFGRIPLGENALRGAELMLTLLRAGGVSDQRAAWFVDLLSLYVMGVAYEDSLSAMSETTPEDWAAYAEQMRAYFASLPADRFPTTIALAAALVGGDRDERFEFGLELLLNGLAVDPAAGRGDRD